MMTSTFSIAAMDRNTGEMGVGVASKVVAVGALVPWAQAAAGAIATQAWTNASYGPEGLRLLAEGLPAKDVIHRLTGADQIRHRRQCGVVDLRGGSAAWTGEKCQPWAGHVLGDGWTCQGNLLAGPEVIQAMTAAFQRASGPLAWRLMTALDAGQAQGGDKRGQQSAALLVVQDKEKHGGFIDRIVDLRVDDHPEPLVELRRLLGLHRQMRPLQKVVDNFVTAAHSDLATVKALLTEHPVLAQARAKWDESGLEAAAHTGQVEIAKFLLAQGAVLDICTAAMLGMADRVQAFLDADPGLARATGAHGVPVMFYSAIGGHRPVAEALYSHGADVNAGEGSNTALHGAALFGRIEMAAWLLDRGANVNARDFRGRTPLGVAADAGHAELVELLKVRAGIE